MTDIEGAHGDGASRRAAFQAVIILEGNHLRPEMVGAADDQHGNGVCNNAQMFGHRHCRTAARGSEPPMASKLMTGMNYLRALRPTLARYRVNSGEYQGFAPEFGNCRGPENVHGAARISATLAPSHDCFSVS